MTIANAAEMTESEVGLGRVRPIAKIRILENAETKHRFKKRYERRKNVSSFSVRPVIGRRIAVGFNSWVFVSWSYFIFNSRLPIDGKCFKKAELVFTRISLNDVDCTNAAYHARWQLPEVEWYGRLASWSINGWSDRLFQLNHLVSKDDESILDISVLALKSNTIRTYLVRILHLPYKTACFPWKNAVSRTTLATRRTTHQGPKQLARNAKELEKPGFLSGEDRTRTFRCFPSVFGELEGIHRLHKN